jgi:hypothetical protein
MIGKLDNWGLPQSHSSALVRKAGYEAWRDFIVPLLDRGRMIDNRTGEAFTDGALELVLRDTWEKIRTDGWSSITPATPAGRCSPTSTPSTVSCTLPTATPGSPITSGSDPGRRSTR